MDSAINTLHQKYRTWGHVLLATLIAQAISVSARAELGEVGFEVKISEKEMILEHPGDMQFKMFAAWDAPYQRIAARSMPWIEVGNLAESTGNLTEFSITIGDTDYNFSDSYMGEYAIQSESTPDVLISSIQSTGDLLTLTFGNGGLAPGEIVRFGIDIDPDPNVDGLFPHPDFRLVLFDMNDMDGNGVEDNAVVSAEFVDPNDLSMTASASTELEDFVVTGPQSQYFNQFVRPYGVMEGIDTFGTMALTGPNPIPEPGAILLAGLATIGLLGVNRRRRQ